MFYSLILIFSFIQENHDRLLWQNGKIAQSNFKGQPNPKVKYSAISSCGINMDCNSKQDTLYVVVESWFMQSKSWVRGNMSIALLKHEQLHFDITELFSRKLRYEIFIKSFQRVSVEKELLRLKTNIEKSLSEFQDLYDAETNHCKDIKKQKEWEGKISKELKKMDSFKETKVKVLLKE